jgi:hypothetical protein
MKTLASITTTLAASAAVLAGLSANIAHGQQPPAQQSVPLPPADKAAAQIVPSTEALAWSQKSLAGWPDTTRRLGAQLATKYGIPTEVTANNVTWRDKGPWKRTTLYKDGPQHNFAAPHKDVLEQAVNYKVPVDKLAEIARFNRSLIPNLTRGELASISDSEELNFLGLNVAHDIVIGERDAEQARTYYAQIVRAKMIKEPEAALQRLKFTPAKDTKETADADEIAPLIKHMSGADGTMNN